MNDNRYSTRDFIVLTCIGVFIAGTAVAVSYYPGGTWWTPSRTGHAFWDNFLCDLLHDPALNQRSNRVGASWARLAMLTLIVGLGVFWSGSERWLSPGRLAKVVRYLGVFSTLPLAMVPLTPSNRFPALHVVAVLLGGLPALVTFLLFCAALLVQKRMPAALRALTACLALLTLLCLTLYAQGALGDGPASRYLPMLERATLILLLVWLVIMLHLPNRPLRPRDG